MLNPVVILQSMISGIMMGGFLALFGVGFSLSWGVMKVINIAHAAFGILGAYITYWGLTLHGIDPILSLGLSLPLLFFTGLLIHRFLIQRITRARDIVVASMILTFGLAILLENAMLLTWSPDERLALVNVVILIIGMLVDTFPAILIMAPLLHPVAMQFGLHPLHFGMVICVNLLIGLITPPVGTNLFVICAIGKVRMEPLVRAVIPFLLVEIIVLFVISYIPILTLYIPKVAGFY